MAPGQVHIKRCNTKTNNHFEGPIAKFEQNHGYQIDRDLDCKKYKNSEKDQTNLIKCLKGVGGLNWSCEACDTTQTMQNGIMAWKFGHYCNETDKGGCSSVTSEVVSINTPVDYMSRTFLLRKACAFAFRDYRRKDKSDFPRTKDTFTPLSINLLFPSMMLQLKVKSSAPQKATTATDRTVVSNCYGAPTGAASPMGFPIPEGSNPDLCKPSYTLKERNICKPHQGEIHHPPQMLYNSKNRKKLKPSESSCDCVHFSKSTCLTYAEDHNLLKQFGLASNNAMMQTKIVQFVNDATWADYVQKTRTYPATMQVAFESQYKFDGALSDTDLASLSNWMKSFNKSPIATATPTIGLVLNRSVWLHTCANDFFNRMYMFRTVYPENDSESVFLRNTTKSNQEAVLSFMFKNIKEEYYDKRKEAFNPSVPSKSELNTAFDNFFAFMNKTFNLPLVTYVNDAHPFEVSFTVPLQRYEADKSQRLPEANMNLYMQGFLDDENIKFRDAQGALRAAPLIQMTNVTQKILYFNGSSASVINMQKTHDGSQFAANFPVGVQYTGRVEHYSNAFMVFLNMIYPAVYKTLGDISVYEKYCVPITSNGVYPTICFEDPKNITNLQEACNSAFGTAVVRNFAKTTFESAVITPNSDVCSCINYARPPPPKVLNAKQSSTYNLCFTDACQTNPRRENIMNAAGYRDVKKFDEMCSKSQCHIANMSYDQKYDYAKISNRYKQLCDADAKPPDPDVKPDHPPDLRRAWWQLSKYLHPTDANGYPILNEDLLDGGGPAISLALVYAALTRSSKSVALVPLVAIVYCCAAYVFNGELVACKPGTHKLCPDGAEASDYAFRMICVGKNALKDTRLPRALCKYGGVVECGHDADCSSRDCGKCDNRVCAPDIDQTRGHREVKVRKLPLGALARVPASLFLMAIVSRATSSRSVALLILIATCVDVVVESMATHTEVELEDTCKPKKDAQDKEADAQANPNN